MRLQKTRTRALLHHISCVPTPDCRFCPGQPESISHLFVGCPCLRPLWSVVSPSGRPHAGPDVPTLLDALSEDLPPMHPKSCNTVILSLLWSIYKSRNRMVFDADLMSTSHVVAMVVDHLCLWIVRAPSRINTGPCWLGVGLSLSLPIYSPHLRVTCSSNCWVRNAAPDLGCWLQPTGVASCILSFL
jgi:hypothetical protein